MTKYLADNAVIHDNILILGDNHYPLYPESKLNKGLRYKFNNLKGFASKLFKEHHVNIPYILLVNSNDLQCTITYDFYNTIHRHSKGYKNVLLIYLGSLKNLNFRTLKCYVGHELGHLFAFSIMHPYKYYYYKLIHSHLMMISFIVSLSTFILTVIMHTNIFWILYLLLILIYIFVPIIYHGYRKHYRRQHHITKNDIKKINNKEARKAEMIADEYSAYILHDVFGVIHCVYQRDDVILAQKAPTTFDTYTSQGYEVTKSIPETLKLDDNLLTSEMYYNSVEVPSDNHPSDRDRIKNLIRFKDSKMTQW